MILVIDNYDSFTYNLVQYLGELGADVVVKRNDAVSVEEIRRLRPRGVLISPGPGRPEEAADYLAQAQVAFAGDPWLPGMLLDAQHGTRETNSASLRYAAAAVTLRPELPELRLELAYVEGRRKKLDDALGDCAMARRLDPKLAEAFALEAQLREWNGDPEGAAPVWKKAIGLAPTAGENSPQPSPQPRRSATARRSSESPSSGWSCTADESAISRVSLRRSGVAAFAPIHAATKRA